MNQSIPAAALQLRSLVQADGTLQISLESIPVPVPGPDEVLIQMQATPINPSDIGLLFGPADLSTAQVSGTPDRPIVSARIPERAMPGLAARIGESMPVGNEGAGLVVAAGSSQGAQALLGRTVAVIGGAMYAQYRAIPAAQCLALPAGTTAAEGASCFVNPLTALGMVETMKREGHKALVHTAAASNLGQMLNRICQKDGIALVNIVRRPEQVALLRGLGAQYVCDSSAPGFATDLTDALAATGATIAFDATGGGTLAGTILQCMENAISRNSKEYSRYGSAVHKQVYLYGHLDTRPTEIHRTFGMAWGIGGWLLFSFLKKIGDEAAQALRERVMAELKTTFASHYARTVSLSEALSAEAIAFYGSRNTGAKVLIDPSK
ncbi:zinc-binding dehydrogenase [Ottowia caeni]|uniref:zinc-binding dehydrogenase n=1 Tax=Ottowia caeni TaxID=2870339 RepID=UPI001E5EB9C5|nr:zinc-binding dehydrogenase [Ottowia caeni]